ncbi:hypothetical protein HPB51_008573 [Rhipicephalus microplus]|uniref:Uncharacterized protein n=1 Tax=Rhipicephalus microplus TaxID=6941 RepID=A0A9J6E8U9_RHIMP|nr:hypothetical protein HPB51_008573 [Rhipicephalus microplus]
MADRVADYSRAHSLNTVTTPPPATAADPALASIENRLHALVRRLDDFVPAHRRPSPRLQIHSRSPTPPRSPELRPTDVPRDVSSSTVCWTTVHSAHLTVLPSPCDVGRLPNELKRNPSLPYRKLACHIARDVH